MMRFHNYLTRSYTAECTEERHGSWYIQLGYAGFNSPANNRLGYATKAKAEAACLRYQRKGGK